MSEKTDNMNCCCDCEYAVKKGLFLKTWYCTCQEINRPYPVRDSVTGEPALNFGEKIPTKVVFLPGNPPLMPNFKTCEAARYFEHEEPCPYFELKGFAPRRKHALPCPPLPKRSEKATQAHDAAYMDNFSDQVFVSTSENGKESPRINGVPMETFVTRLHQKAKEFQAENRQLRGLICEIREFLIGGAIPGKVHLKQESIRDIYTIASEEDEKRRNEK